MCASKASTDVTIRVHCDVSSRRGRRRSKLEPNGDLRWADLKAYLAGGVADPPECIRRQEWEPRVDESKTHESISEFELTRGFFQKVLTLLLNVSLYTLIASAPSNYIAR